MAFFVVSLALAVTGGASNFPADPNPQLCHGGRILLDGPGYGYGFPNNSADGYGWFDYGTALPLGGNRTPDYYFPRYLSIPMPQMVYPSYYNPYMTRGQRYLAYAGCGGEHPAGGLPTGPALTPVHPYQETLGNGPRVKLPDFTGRIEADPVNTGSTGLTP